MEEENYKGKKITIMGLGLTGGGTASAKFFASRGAEVTVTDLRSGEILKPSIDLLSGYKIRYVLGRHDLSDFENADIVIKNPAVSADSPYLKKAKRIETDISVFLSSFKGNIIAVTGSKGKSTTVSALYYGMKKFKEEIFLGGNITISPLSFTEKLTSSSLVILELSSWQLADIRGRNLLSPSVAVITNIMREHQNKYKNMEDYVNDKKIIYSGQNKNQFTLCNHDDPYGKGFYKETPGEGIWLSENPLPEEKNAAWLEGTKGYIKYNGTTEEIMPEKLRIPGYHNRKNILTAAAVMYLYGFKSSSIKEALKDFPGIPHRLEFVREKEGRKFYNDTAATIPQAAEAAVKSFDDPVILIAGGTDKNLNFEGFEKTASKVKKLFLLEGNGTDKMIEVLNKNSCRFSGPYKSLEKALDEAYSSSERGDIIMLSPGCASFNMFSNEFDRGNQFKKLVNQL